LITSPPPDIPAAPRVILFDLGNTLIYFDSDWGPVMQTGVADLVKTLLNTGFQLDVGKFSADFHQRMLAYYLARDIECIEHTTASVLQNLLGEYGHPLQPLEVLRPALDAFYAASQPHWQPEVDAIPVLNILRSQGYRLAIISNASDADDVNTLIKQSGLSPYFEKVFISAEVGLRKPHPRIFRLALDHFAVEPHHTVMVGDTLSADIQGANQLGMRSVWITRRADRTDNHENHSKIKPSAIISTLIQLLDVLEEWQSK
jgi:2-haloalkanoic acid dehalogenase type II